LARKDVRRGKSRENSGKQIHFTAAKPYDRRVWKSPRRLGRYGKGEWSKEIVNSSSLGGGEKGWQALGKKKVIKRGIEERQQEDGLNRNKGSPRGNRLVLKRL